MAEIIRERNAGSAIGWLSLIIAVGALVIAIAAYNRSGTNLDTRIRDMIRDSTNNVQQQADDAGNNATDATDRAEEMIDTGPDGVDDGSR